MRQYMATHPEQRAKDAARRRARFAADPDAARAASRIRNAKYRALRRAQKLASQKKYRTERREADLASKARYREANRERVRAYNREYDLQHPERVLLRAARRRARLAGAAGRYTTQEWMEKLELFAHCCAYCGEARALGPDHKVPLSRGGSDEILNVVPACIDCNRRKGSRTAAEFLAQRRAA